MITISSCSGLVRFGRCGRWAACDRWWPLVAACGRLWPLVAAGGRLWPLVAAGGHLWPLVAACGRLHRNIENYVIYSKIMKFHRKLIPKSLV